MCQRSLSPGNRICGECRKVFTAAIAEWKRCEGEARKRLDRAVAVQANKKADTPRRAFNRGYWLGRAQSWEDAARVIEEILG